MGVVPDPVLPVLAALLLIAVAATVLPGVLHRTDRPGPDLRAE